MTRVALTFLASAVLATASATAQGPNFLTTFSTGESNISTSGGTVLGSLRPNEINFVDFVSGPCTGVSAEKWLPRTCSHVMAGDEDGDGTYFRPNIFGRIDAVLALSTWLAPVPWETQRTAFWSPRQPMGTAISTPFRPGDVARIVNGPDGTIEYFMRQEQFNTALGLPPATPINVDAIAFQPNYGIFFSLADDIVANTTCGPLLVRDGDVLCIPGGMFSTGGGLLITGVAPSSAVVIYNEAAMNSFTVNAQVTDRFGACLTGVGDTTALEVDTLGPVTSIVICTGATLRIPTLIYACENGTGASVLTTRTGGQIYNTPCGLAGTGCGSGPTFGPQWGIQPTSALVGAPSYVNGLAFTRTCVSVLEPQQHVMNVFPVGAPFGANMVDYNSPFFELILISLPPPTIPTSVTVAPLYSANCFPDLYTTPVISWVTVPAGFGSFPTPAIPALWTGKVLFQGVGFAPSGLELSTPAVIDVQ